ncbi:Cytochrome b5 domain-containing protein 1 [Terramyces sp. JEL0728]|nr:Cytochrome b5 domain-containing protein 1 [Terramyces sp. JEL0728]
MATTTITTTGSISAIGTQKKTYPYFTPEQVLAHDSPDDCWLSWLGCVYNLTEFCQKHAGDPQLTPILANAGQDISHWFDPETGNLKTQINLLTDCKTYAKPYGRLINVSPHLPQHNWDVDEGTKPWWIDQSNCMGYLSKKTRKIRIQNTLTKDEHILEVCTEDSLSAIQERYSLINAHAKGYMWKRLNVLLDMNLTLEENGIPDEDELFNDLGINNDQWLPVIHLYFSDDLTVA